MRQVLEPLPGAAREGPFGRAEARFVGVFTRVDEADSYPANPALQSLLASFIT
jgi:hypothetical protein